MTEDHARVEISEPGGPEVLTPHHAPGAGARAGQILIKVAYAGVNRPDALQRAGSYAPPPGASDLPGLEAAGIVAVWARGHGWAVGDRVCALLPGGGYAEYVLTPRPPLPAGPEGHGDAPGGLPARDLLHRLDQRLHARRSAGGERFLCMADRRASARRRSSWHDFGARVFATAGSAEKCAACVELGAERAINYREEDFVEILKRRGRREPDPRHGGRRLPAAQRQGARR
jgi:NADPH2:quinone reductase